jgi:hypothetical protein
MRHITACRDAVRFLKRAKKDKEEATKLAGRNIKFLYLKNYVFNYQRDSSPSTPPFNLFHLSPLRELQKHSSHAPV